MKKLLNDLQRPAPEARNLHYEQFQNSGDRKIHEQSSCAR